MIIIKKYSSDLAESWNKFVKNSKNGTFLFDRCYMDYHSDRFIDASVLFYKNEELVALLPANIDGDVFYSHQGLTYGGVVSGNAMKSCLMLEIFDSLLDHLRKNGIKTLRYKAVPHIYHTKSAEEDLYALFRNGARLFRRDLASVICQDKKLQFERGRKRCIESAKKNGLVVKKTSDFRRMYRLMEELLITKYNSKPVHTADEMELLSNRFSNNITLFGCYKEDIMISGAWIFDMENITHAQYVYSSEIGKNFGANDMMYDHLINLCYKDKKYFDFGISTEQEGKYLNTGLIGQKEMFGARAICYDQYELKI